MATLTQGRKVVQTRSFRGSKSRNKVSVGEPAEGSLRKEESPTVAAGSPAVRRSRPPSRGVPPTLVYYTFVALAGRVKPPAHAGERPPEAPTLDFMMSEYYIIVKTFNNGSLGSGIDEERSEMR